VAISGIRALVLLSDDDAFGGVRLAKYTASPLIRTNAAADRACADNGVRVKDVLELLAAGAGREEILSDYPSLEDGDITASLEYAARQSDHPVLRVA
jgi:uncharacterized protein (DUF433 family)